MADQSAKAKANWVLKFVKSVSAMSMLLMAGCWRDGLPRHYTRVYRTKKTVGVR